MNNNDLYLQYRQAIQLIRVGRYEESLQILQEIDAERPETKNVHYAMAVCLEMLGRTREALDYCDRLIAKHDHPKARVIRARIEKAATQPELPKVDLISGLGVGRPPVAPPSVSAPTAPPPTGEKENIPFALPVSGRASKDKPARKNWLFGLGKKS